MNKRMIRVAAALTVMLFVSAASVQGGAIPANSHNQQKQSGARSASKPQPSKPQPSKPQPSKPQPSKPQPQPPKPQPQNSAQQSSNVIGSLSSGSTIGSLSSGSTIGSLSSGSTIGSLSSGSMIGSLHSGARNYIKASSSGGNNPSAGEPAKQTAKKAEQNMPQAQDANPPPPSGDRPLRNDAPQAQVQNEPAPAQDKPIVIMPRSVQAGNTGSGSSSGPRGGGQHPYGEGYSGGDGQGPLIYNP